LTAYANDKGSFRSRWKRHIHKRLMNVQLVLIDRPRTSRSSALEAALDLEEDSRAVAEMQIGVKHVALEKVAAVIFRTTTPTRINEPFVLHARFAAYR